MTATLHVCTTCRREADPDAGARLFGALSGAGLRVLPVACLSACDTSCAVALSGPGKWSYVYHRLSAADAPDILAGARAYAASPDGIVPWRQRPAIFRKNALARIPPLEPT